MDINTYGKKHAYFSHFPVHSKVDRDFPYLRNIPRVKAKARLWWKIRIKWGNHALYYFPFLFFLFPVKVLS